MKLSSIFFIAFCAFSLLSTSCKKESQTEIELEYPIIFPDLMEIDVKSVDSFVIRESNDFPTSLDGELAKHNTNKSKIKSAKLTFMRLQVMDYAFADSTKYSDFGYISELMMDIKKDGLGQALIAKKSIPNMRTKAVNLDLENVELKDYLQQETFKMVFKYKKRKAMPNDMPYVITLKFKIIADPI